MSSELHRRSASCKEQPCAGFGLSDSSGVDDKNRREQTASLLAEFLAEYRAAHRAKAIEAGAPKPPKPTGIKPRGCILPVLVVLLLSIPLLGLCLPVFLLGARQSNSRERERADFICLLYPLNSAASHGNASALLSTLNATYINSPVLQAWVAWAEAEEDLLADADNATAQAAAQAAQARLLARQERFFAALRRNCSTVASVLWGRAHLFASSQPYGRGGESLYDSPAWTYWIELNRQPWSPDQLPPAPPPPPSAPPSVAAMVAEGSSGAAAQQALDSGSSGSAGGNSSSAGPVAKAMVVGGDYDGDYSPPAPPLPPGMAPPRPPLYGIAAYVLINATLISMDVVTGLARQNVEVHLGSLNPWAAARTARAAALGRAGAAWLLDEHDRLQPDGVQVHLDVVTATGGGLVTLGKGDRVGFKQMDIIVDVLQSSYFYPYDEYRAVVKIVSYVGNSTYRYPIALLLNQRNAAVGWAHQVETLPDVQENYVLWWSGSSENQEGEVHMTYAIMIRRSIFNKLFCFLILVGMWVLSGCAATYAVDLVLLRPRNAALVDATMFVTLLFAMPNIRNVMPGVPAIGIGIDMFGFIWIMLLCICSGSMVLAKLAAQYVHPAPTLYDRAVRNECYREWEKKKQEKKEKTKEKEQEQARGCGAAAEQEQESEWRVGSRASKGLLKGRRQQQQQQQQACSSEEHVIDIGADDHPGNGFVNGATAAAAAAAAGGGGGGGAGADCSNADRAGGDRGVGGTTSAELDQRQRQRATGGRSACKGPSGRVPGCVSDHAVVAVAGLDDDHVEAAAGGEAGAVSAGAAADADD